ncbi:hypothetical protein IOCL2690_000664600 [Leishmania lindenbergi]|uniref:Uncharacterized protein n=1 Tax=Leishmania lindenbergi TaxID=651832 RepID=A0AAW3A404_9TRYP
MEANAFVGNFKAATEQAAGLRRLEESVSARTRKVVANGRKLCLEYAATEAMLSAHSRDVQQSNAELARREKLQVRVDERQQEATVLWRTALIFNSDASDTRAESKTCSVSKSTSPRRCAR